MRIPSFFIYDFSLPLLTEQLLDFQMILSDLYIDKYQYNLYTYIDKYECEVII